MSAYRGLHALSTLDASPFSNTLLRKFLETHCSYRVKSTLHTSFSSSGERAVGAEGVEEDIGGEII